jgi:adenylosuccinate synthase
MKQHQVKPYYASERSATQIIITTKNQLISDQQELINDQRKQMDNLIIETTLLRLLSTLFGVVIVVTSFLTAYFHPL